MKKVKELHANGFYLLEGVNSANTHLIENQNELDQFFIFADAYFRNYMTVYDYCVTHVGWNILVQIKDEATILDLYAKAQERRNKPANLSEAWLILSNQIRLFRFRMTRWTNKKRNREGNASKCTYRRYLFTSLEEGIDYINKIRNQEISFDQKNPKYQPLAENFDQDKDIAKNRKQLSSKAAQEDHESLKKEENQKKQENQKKAKSYLPCLKICNYISTHLEKWIKKTCELHNLTYETMELRL